VKTNLGSESRLDNIFYAVFHNGLMGLGIIVVGNCVYLDGVELKKGAC
jgi:hypothetical protein